VEWDLQVRRGDDVKVLFIGGSGNISTACSRLAVERGIDLFLLNRGYRRTDLQEAVRRVRADYSDPAGVRSALAGEYFDAVVNFIVYEAGQAEQDIETFAGRTRQYMLISSATVYRKPPPHYLISEQTPLGNPFWGYARKKIAAERALLKAHKERGFPVTIVRPSFTYGDEWVPTSMSVDFTPVARLRKGLPLVVHGDGTALWVMTHARDFARGLVGLLGLEAAIGEAVHITSDEVLSWNQIYGAIARAAGSEPRWEHIPSDFIARINPQIGCGLLGDKAYSTVFDNTKIKRLVPEFRCSVPFESGVAQTVEFLDAHPERQETDRNDAIEEILKAWKLGMEAAEHPTG
jgi:nucleoside-diphosphate-sugar epimerase